MNATLPFYSIRLRWGLRIFCLLVGTAALMGWVSVSHPQSREPAPSYFQSMTWRSIGPFRGGRVVAVAGIASDPQTYYFGGVGGGVFKTTNGGTTWTNVSDGYFSTSSVGAIALAPSNPKVVYVGMGEHSIRGTTLSHGDGVYKSSDAGKSWVHLGLEATRVISRIRINPTNPDVVYIAAQGTPYVPSDARGVFRSKDGGKTWEKTLFVNDVTGPADLAMDMKNPQILYAAMWDHQRKPWNLRSGGRASGVYKTVDGGDSWQKIVQGLPKVMGRIGITISADPNRLYALVECNPNGGLYRSDDAGKSWKLVNSSWDLISRPWYYMRLEGDPADSDIIWIMNSQVYRSVDGGKTFSRVNIAHPDEHDIWINPKTPNTLIIGNDGGATVSFDGGRTWSTQQNQPTGQFYRVNVDDRFPYWVYGGQQDSTTVGIPSATEHGTITERDWYPVGGGESGFVDFDKRDPSLIYAGSWGGQITEFDQSRKYAREMMAYPKIGFGLALRERKYRFNYNAPIVVSRHDKKVIYHAAQKLLRTEDRGISWTEVSPDLTRPTDKTQGIGGGPFWPEGEIYDTITYVAESPHDRKVLWTGSDDGVIALTRDGGGTWQRFSLPGLSDALINEIEVSPHDPATAYVAASRYKFNDYRPQIFKTNNFGQSWERIVDGISAESWSRVVREDPKRKGLLYAGTETGVFVSLDDGKHWESLQLNMPVTPITDLQVHDADLVVSTLGRGFWILDDVSTLQQISGSFDSGSPHLFQPRVAFRTNIGGGGGGIEDEQSAGTNSPAGAILTFYVPSEGVVTIEILSSSGEIIRRYSSQQEQGRQPSLKIKPGMNRLVWDLRHELLSQVRGAPGLFRMGGRLVKPGTYAVRLTASDKTLSAPLEVRLDPRWNVPAEGFAQQDQLLVAIEHDVAELNHDVLEIRNVREQIDTLMKRNPSASVTTAGKDLSSKLELVEDALIQKNPSGGQRAVVEPSRLSSHFNFLHVSVNQVIPEVTQGEKDLYVELSKEFAGYKAQLANLLTTDLVAFNQLLTKEGISEVVRVSSRGNQ
ncbi:MAG: glycosyl hydrolase [Acidobacteria bacterium]|nr:MAG: glycosyl hydrolase [Acidobacteriota bacterium]